MWLIQTDQTQKLRVIDGRHRHKAGNAGLLVGAVQLLAGAAFAAHPVARDLRVAPAAVQHHCLHHLPHGGRGGGLDHLPFADRGGVGYSYLLDTFAPLASEAGVPDRAWENLLYRNALRIYKGQK